jgi:MFS transporter, DHA2 family, methylenomycin A resistance protein
MAGIMVGNLCSSRCSARFGMPNVILFCGGGAAVVTLLLAVTQSYVPYPLLLAGVTSMSFLIAVAVPAMTTMAMQIAGRTYANSAAAALNANRQIGALVGVALMGIILHTVLDWSVRLPLAFGALTLAFGAISFLVHYFVRLPKPA